MARGMSQNREQRFATAEGMRAALRGSGEVATLAGRSEAATVVLPTAVTTPSEAATRIDPNAKPTAIPGETTVVQTPVIRKRRIAPWAVAAAAVILLGGVVVAYYGYQQGKNSAGAAPAPATSTEIPAVAQPTHGSATIAPASAGAKVDSAGPRTDPNPKRNETAAKPVQGINETRSQTSPPTVPAPPRAETSPTQQRAVAEPNVTVGDPPGTPDLGVFRRRRQGEVQVRTLPDGTKVMMSPDGTRSVILPDGTRRVLRPGVRPRRRP